MPYLVGLTIRLAAGLETLPEAERRLHLSYLRSQQLADGGFAGRGEGSDLYYTAFALRCVVLLGEESAETGQRVADYLRKQSLKTVSVIDLISHLFAARLLESWAGISDFAISSADGASRVSQVLEALRRPDGGYAKTAEGHASSTYQTFLIALAYQLLKIPLPDPQRAGEFVLGQQRPDGGFVEIGVMRRSGVNPTAAAVGALIVLQSQLEEELLSTPIKDQTARFLSESATDEGGYRANTQIPIADLLSTYTALQTLCDLGYQSEINKDAALEFVNSLQVPQGGFRAAAWDDAVDVEYSFYGLASLGLLLT